MKMATRLIYGTLVAAMGGFGPRAQAFALESPSVRVVVAAPAVALSRGLGSSFFDFIPAALSAVGGIASNVPSIAAAFGDKPAQQYEAQQNQLQLAATQATTAPYQAETSVASSNTTMVGYAAAGVVGLGLALAIGLALSGSGRSANPRRRRVSS